MNLHIYDDCVGLSINKHTDDLNLKAQGIEHFKLYV